jgi:hypothetical protein
VETAGAADAKLNGVAALPNGAEPNTGVPVSPKVFPEVGALTKGFVFCVENQVAEVEEVPTIV